MSPFVVCNIYCPKEKDFEILKEYLSKYPVYIHRKQLEEYNGKPTLIVGWKEALQASPKQNVFKKKINNTVSWTFGSEEDDKVFIDDVKNFVNDALKKWLPDNFETYDPFFDGDISEWSEVNINGKSFSFYDNGALYLNSGGKNFILNIKSLLFSDPQKIIELTNIINKTTPLSYNNVRGIVDIDTISTPSFESMYWVSNSMEVDETMFNLIPGFDYKKYVPFFMSIMPPIDLDEEELKSLDRMVVRDRATAWVSNSLVPVVSDFEANGKEVVVKGGKRFINLNFSNKRTITNRVVCKDIFNVQNIPKDSPSRKGIISEFRGGSLFICDYTSFETRISLFMTRDKDFINSYKREDIHYEVGKTIFNKEVLTNGERDFAKNLNHAFLYGASHRKVIMMLSKHVDDPEQTLYFVKKQLGPIIDMVEKINKEGSEFGYVKTKWGLIIKPEKEYAYYNNLVQSTASEIMVDKIIEIRELLKDKKSNFLFQVHDSMIFDIHPEEKVVAKQILQTLSKFKNTAFTIKHRHGSNYLDLSEEKYYIFS